MRKTVVWCLLGIALGLAVPYAAGRWIRSFELSEENTIEHSRITLGGAHSIQGEYVMTDSVTLNCGGGFQQSNDYEIAGVNIQANNGIATAIGADCVYLLWTSPGSEDCTGFLIMRSTSPEGGFEQVASLGADDLEYVDTGLRAGTTYYYQILAIDGESNTTPVTSPMMVTTEGGSDTSISLESNWGNYE